jgi:hypothetical protein
MLDKLTSQDFLPYLNEEFRIEAGSGESREAELIEVTNLESAAARPEGTSSRSPFSVVFRCSPDVVLQQRIYEVRHEAMGAMDVFLVPIGPDEVGIRYEALFA